MVMANAVRRSNALNQYSGDRNALKYYEVLVHAGFMAAFIDMLQLLVFGTVTFFVFTFILYYQ